MFSKNKQKFNIILVAIMLISMVLPNFAINSAIAATTASNLFISEYIEGTSFNKAIEIYNGTGSAVKLSEYTLELYSNGSATTTFTLALSSDSSATLANGKTFVISRNDAEPAIQAKANLIHTNSTVINWNGDDAVVLKHNGTIIDVIGQVGSDPGTTWGTTIKTQDQTIVRKSSITAGDSNPSDAFDPATEWDSLGLNVFTNLGIHTMDGASTPVETIAEVRASALQSNVQTSGVVTAVLGRAIYFQDATAGIVAYTPTDSTTIQPGDKITVSGKLTEFSTLLEIEANHENIVVTDQVAVPDAEVLTAAQLEESKEAKLVTVKNATVGTFSGGNYTVTDADGTSFQIRPPSSTMLTSGTTYEAITGVLSAFNGVYQLIPRNEGDILLDSSIVRAVIATPGAGLVNTGTEVTLATATEGAAIHYTLDGGEPTTDSPAFTQPIVINEATTIKAVAVKEGMKNSAVASFDYVIQDGPIHIYDIQGKTHNSLLNGKTVTDVEGVVTYIDGTSRFFIQDLVGDGDNNTSDGILVFKSAHGVAIGDVVKITGKVTEFYGEGFAEKTTTDLTITEIEASTITKNGTAPVPAPIKLGVDRIAPTEVIDNDQFGTFDPAEDAVDFWESIEGMYAQVDDGKVIALQKDGLVWVVPGTYPTNVNPGGLRITATDTNPDRIGVDVRNGSTANKSYRAKMGDFFTGAIKGVVNYGFSNYKLMTQESSLPTLTETSIVRAATKITPAADKLTIGTYNVENFSASTPDEKVTKIADAIVTKMKNPDIIGLNEVQDNSGETDNGTVDGTQSAQKIIDKVIALGGPTYAYTEVAPVDKQDGGAPGGNIRVAFLYNKDRVSLTTGAPKGTATQAVGFENGKLTLNPGRIDPTNAAFNASRKPLAAQFEFQGQSVIVVANHFNSKGGDSPLFGKTQPPVLSSEIQRHKIAAIVNNFVKDVKAKDANANVVLLGDFNDFEFTKTLEIAKGNELTNMVEKVPADERYNYSYQGNAQVLDQVLVTNNMAGNTTVDILHINSGFMEEHGRASDHDPIIIQTQLKAAGEVLPPVTPPASTKVYNLNGFKTKKLTVSNAAADITVSATSVITEGIVIKSSYAKLSGEGLKTTTIILSPTAPGAIIDFGGAEVKEVVIDNANISQIRGIEKVLKWTVKDGVDTSKIKFTNVGGEVLTSPLAPPKVNQAPVISKALPNVSVQVGTPVSVNLTDYFADPDGDALTYTTTAGTVQGSTLTVQTPLEGTINVTVTAIDGTTTVNDSFTISVTAVPANNVETYYQAAAGKTGADLKLSLHKIIKVQTKKLTYDEAREAIKLTDEDPNNPNNVILLYTNRSQAKSTFGPGVDQWNREHVWAKSHGDFGTSVGPGTDIHHLRPTDVSVNSARGHLDFDNGGSTHIECTECKYDSDSWEPPNRVKGDIARMLMYMDVRYEGDNGELNLELADKVNTYPTPFHGKKSVLLQWSKMDPPDAFEKKRNDVIESIQGNRNPFIDHPEWAESIWPAS